MTSLIRSLNDKFRQTPPLKNWLLTSGVRGKGDVFVAQAIVGVGSFTAFTDDNDPYGEHDFGAFTLDGEKVFWKIDYYNPDLTGGSEDPSDPAKTRRVMTIMLAEEY